MRRPCRGGCFAEVLLLCVAALVFGAAGIPVAWLLHEMTKHLLAR